MKRWIALGAGNASPSRALCAGAPAPPRNPRFGCAPRGPAACAICLEISALCSDPPGGRPARGALLVLAFRRGHASRPSLSCGIRLGPAHGRPRANNLRKGQGRFAVDTQKPQNVQVCGRGADSKKPGPDMPVIRRHRHALTEPANAPGSRIVMPGKLRALGRAIWPRSWLAVAICGGCASTTRRCEEIPDRRDLLQPRTRGGSSLTRRTHVLLQARWTTRSAIENFQEVIDNYPVQRIRHTRRAQDRRHPLRSPRSTPKRPATTKTFVELHPRHEMVPHALFRNGLCSHEQIHEHSIGTRLRPSRPSPTSGRCLERYPERRVRPTRLRCRSCRSPRTCWRTRGSSRWASSISTAGSTTPRSNAFRQGA